MKMKNRDQLDTTNRPMSRYVLKYTKYYNTLLITTFYKWLEAERSYFST